MNAAIPHAARAALLGRGFSNKRIALELGVTIHHEEAVAVPIATGGIAVAGRRPARST